MKASLLLSFVALAVLSSHGAARPTPWKMQMIKPDIEVADAGDLRTLTARQSDLVVPMQTCMQK
jgi:hypothetical protein